MPTSRELLNRRKAVSNTRKITKTMELVATAKLQKAQQAAVESRPYARTLREVMGELAAASEGIDHPLLRVRKPLRKTVVLIITSDRGLCGAFNTNVLRKAYALLEKLTGEGREIELAAIGKKAVSSLTYRGHDVAQKWTGISDKPTFEHADEIATGLIERYAEQQIDETYIAYSEFVSISKQEARVERLLPLSALDEGNGGGDGEEPHGAGSADYIFHPSPEEILAEMLPLVIKNSIFNAMLQNAAGEHAARRLAMKNATDAADDMIVAITRQYNRMRQARITQEIAEIVGGAEAL